MSTPKNTMPAVILAINLMVLICRGQIIQSNSASVAQANADLLQTWAAISNHWQPITQTQIKTAAEQGDLSAQFYLGMEYFNGVQLVGDEDEAIKWIKNAAEHGLAAAEHNLAWRYSRGDGVEKDDDLATKWYQKAADQGFVKSQIALGIMYGRPGPRRDNELAEQWLRKANEHNSAEAQYWFGYLLSHEFDKTGKWVPNFPEAAEWFTKAAEQGDAKAQYELAELYHTGKLGDDQRSNCIPWFLKAAANGNAEAQSELGGLRTYYPNSELLKTVNPMEALEPSAAAGNFEAQFQLAKRYQSGDGVPKDPSEAFNWMQKAANNGGPYNSQITDAMYSLALMYERGEGVPKDVSKAQELFMRAVEMNRQPAAAFRVGQMYENGEGVPQDDRKAAEFYANVYLNKDTSYIDPAKYPNGLMEYAPPTSEGMESLLRLWAHGRGFPDDGDKTLPGYRTPGDLMKYWANLIATANARYYAGEMYYQGKLVPKDAASAADWFTKAAEQGSPDAMNRIGEMWASGMNGAPDPKEAASWYRKAAAQGLAEAQLNLGECFAKGEGLAADPVEAWKWLQLAAGQKVPKAAEELAKVQSTMTADQLQEARTRADQFRKRDNQ